MVIEHAGNRRGLLGSLVQIGFPVGVAASTGIFAVLTKLPEADFLSWGWRVPFLASLLLVAIGFVVRLRLAETPEFKQVVERKEVLAQPVLEVLRRDWRSFLLAVGITVSEVGLAYLLTVFTVVYATSKLGLPRQVILDAVVYAALVEFVTLPAAGWLSDIFGRKALYLAGGIFSVALAFPLFWFLNTKEPALITAALVITMTLTHALLFGPKAAFMPELFRTRVRYSGASLGANVAAALSGGFSPLIAAALLAWSGSYWPVSLYIIALSVITIISTLMTPETARAPLRY
jgi:MFS family permease